MKIVLLGKDGQVGRELSRSLLPLGQVTALGRGELDLTDLKGVKQLLGQIKPNLIVNAAAYTAVDKAETDSSSAYKINEELVQVLATYAKQQGAFLIHYSTDYVFDGTKGGAYQEKDNPQPLNVYGKSKLAGEQAIIESGCLGYTFRTSWVYSPYGHNFIKTILNLAKQRETLSIVSDQHGAPTSAELISDVSLLAIRAAAQDQLQPGIYHLTASGQTTWYDLACYIIEKAKTLGIEFKIKPSEIHPILTEAYPLPAQRPKNSVLNNQTLATKLQIALPDWTVYVNRMVNQLIELKYLSN